MIRSFRKKNCLLMLTATLLLLGSAVVLAQREPVPANPDLQEKPVVAPPEEKETKSKRIREGTCFRGKRVFFRTVGQRTMLYYLNEAEGYVCLENLNLERILNAMAERPGRGLWTVDGEFTEFRGENYILIKRAVLSPQGLDVDQSK